MIKVKKVNGRWRWLEYSDRHNFIYLTDQAVEQVLKMISERPIEENKIYEVDDVYFSAMNHSSKCTGAYPDNQCYECGGEGVLLDCAPTYILAKL